MTIKYNEIIAGDISKIFDEKKVIELKEKAAKERQFINKKIKGTFPKYFGICAGAHERVYTYSTYSDMTEKEKAFIYANIVFPDNVKFVRMLNNTISYEYLTMYINSLKTLKMAEKFHQEDEKKQKLLNYCNKISSLLYKKVEMYLGKSCIEPIITKTSEILAYNKDLLINDENTKKIKR